MENNHLTYFKIENFKKFDALEVNDIGQFNLVVGDNNVGKTCFLEALLFDEDEQQLLNNFYIALTKRGFDIGTKEIKHVINDKIVYDYEFPDGNYFLTIQKNVTKYTKFIFEIDKIKKEIDISPVNIGGTKQLVDHSQFKVPFENHVILINNKPFNVYNYDKKALNFPLINFNTSIEEETLEIFNSSIKEGKKQTLINALKVISPDIIDINFTEDKSSKKKSLLITVKDEKIKPFPINFLGDGFKRIFSITLKILTLGQKLILIDEIEIGIHHSKLKEFWINVIKICKELDVQLFATTHSEECIEAYCLALKELELEENGKVILLQEEQEKIVSYTFETKNLDLSFDYRG